MMIKEKIGVDKMRNSGPTVSRPGMRPRPVFQSACLLEAVILKYCECYIVWNFGIVDAVWILRGKIWALSNLDVCLN